MDNVTCWLVWNKHTNINETCCNSTKPNNHSTRYNNCTGDGEWTSWFPAQPYHDIYITNMALVVSLVVLGNAFILYKLNPFRRLQRHSNIELLILYLSVFDLVTVLFLITDIYENVTRFRNWPFGWFGCKVIYPSFNMSLTMSVCVLIIMSIDRCRSIRHPLRKKFTRRSIHVAVLLALFFTVPLQWFQFKGHSYEDGVCNVARSDAGFLTAKITFTLIRDIIFLLIFTATTYLIVHSLSRNALLDSIPGRKSEVIIMLITMESVFAVLVVPYDVYDVAMMISNLPGYQQIEYTEKVWHIDRVLSILQMSNSFANCFIYAKMHKYLAKNNRRDTSTSTMATAVDSRKWSRQASQDLGSGTGNAGYITSAAM